MSNTERANEHSSGEADRCCCDDLNGKCAWCKRSEARVRDPGVFLP